MAKAAYIGVDNTARKISKGYIGVDGVAREIKKGYVGVGGVARPCWSGGELVWYGGSLDGAVDPILLMDNVSCACSTDEYAIFAGAKGMSIWQGDVCAYDTFLIRSTPAALACNVQNSAAASNGNYALFGGMRQNKDDDGSVVKAYDHDLTLTTIASLEQARDRLAAASNGTYTLFGGGRANSESSNVTAYNSALVRSRPASLSDRRCDLAAASNGTYILFGGGDDGDRGVAVVDAYDIDLVHTTASSLPNAAAQNAATSNGTHILFGGGFNGNATSAFDSVCAFNTELVRSTLADLKAARFGLRAASLSGYSLFGPGQHKRGGGSGYRDVDVYDAMLVYHAFGEPSASYLRARYDIAANARYLLIGGGYDESGDSESNNIDVYTIA